MRWAFIVDSLQFEITYNNGAQAGHKNQKNKYYEIYNQAGNCRSF